MTLEKIIHSVEQGLAELAGRLQDTRSRLEEEEDRLGRELEMVCRGLRSWQQELTRTQQRLTRNREAISQLPAQIEALVRQGNAARAYPLALELELARAELPADEANLPRQQQTCWSLQFRIRQLVRQRQEVRRKLAGG